jgi:hypothetical protein
MTFWACGGKAAGDFRRRAVAARCRRRSGGFKGPGAHSQGCDVLLSSAERMRDGGYQNCDGDCVKIDGGMRA